MKRKDRYMMRDVRRRGEEEERIRREGNIWVVECRDVGMNERETMGEKGSKESRGKKEERKRKRLENKEMNWKVEDAWIDGWMGIGGWTFVDVDLWMEGEGWSWKDRNGWSS